MRFSIAFRVVIALCLLLVNFAGLYTALHPKVSDEYRAYYIDRTVQDWRPSHYASSPEQGMAMGDDGLPEFVESTQGFAFRESWGRWAESSSDRIPTVRLKQSFDGPVCVVVTAHPSAAELGHTAALAFGSERQSLRPSVPEFADYYLDFNLTQPANTLTFSFPRSASERSLSLSLRYRPVALAISRIRIFQRGCETLERTVSALHGAY
jgi:hypothetical protein